MSRAALEILRRPFRAGTRVINCVAHSGLPLTNRPDDCRLCLADIKNQLALALRVNEFLNEVKDEAIAAMTTEAQTPGAET